MRHSKRLLGLWAAMLMLLLFAVGTVSAAGYTPAAEQLAADRMLALKLLTGSADGLQLKGPITRAQFVTVMVRAFGQGETAQMLMGANTGFEDVTPAEAWATGYIAMAKNLVEKNGHRLGVNAEGTQFAPQANLTAAEAVAFLMKFLGVHPSSGLPWPANYLTPAVEKGIITAEDRALVESHGGAPATRGLVFYLLDHAFYNYKGIDGKTIYTTFVDPILPVITLNTYPGNVAETSVTISGTVSTDVVHFATPQGPIPFDKATGAFSVGLNLAEGLNRIQILAVDRAGNEARAEVTVARARPVSISASIGSGQVPVNHSVNLIVTFTVDGKEADPLPYTVTVDPSLGTFDAATNTFTAGLKPGKGVLTVEAQSIPKIDLPIEVFNGLAKLEVTPNSIAALPGEEIQMSVRGLDYLNQEVPLKTVSWSVVMNAARIDATGTLTIPDIQGVLIVNVFADGQFGTAYLLVNSGDIQIEANVPSTLKPGEIVHIPILAKQDGKVLNLPIQVETKVGKWDPATQTLTAKKVPGKGNFLIYVAGITQEYWIEVTDSETEGTGEAGETGGKADDQVAGLTVSGDKPVVQVASPLQLSVTAYNARGEEVPFDGAVTWSCSSADAVIDSRTGVFVAMEPGYYTVTATVGEWTVEGLIQVVE